MRETEQHIQNISPGLIQHNTEMTCEISVGTILRLSTLQSSCGSKHYCAS